VNAGLVIVKLLNFPIDSNCYIIINKLSGNCIIVDPAQGDGESLDIYLVVEKLIPSYIIITHEHFDHISSVEYIRKKHKCKVVASTRCSESIMNSKKNLSVFFDQKGFNCGPADLIINRNDFEIKWQGEVLRFYLTPGHSEGGICFSMGDNLFTGDTILRSLRPIVKLPGGNKKALEKSIQTLLDLFDGQTHIFPGHGETFKLRDLEVNINK